MTQTRIKQRFDVLSNWLKDDIILLNGELAVVDCGPQTRFKIGDGQSRFTQLQFIDQNQLSTKHLIVEAISQGPHTKSVPYGFAAGAYLCADASFSQALGYNSQTVSSDQYAFAWNGDDTRMINDYYQSHGKGTFNVNPLSGLSGFYIGEQSLADILSSSGNKVTIVDNTLSISQQSDLSVVKLDVEEYAQMIATSSTISNCLYIVESSCMNAYGQQLKNLAAPTDLSDATTKEYVDNAISNIEIPEDLSAFTNSPGYLVSDDISGYYKKTETSSSIELSDEFANKLEASEVNISYDSTARKILLSSKANVTSVDCNDFIKDGMLSTVKLCSGQLVFNFNTDAGSNPISIELSNFIDETQYWKKNETSSASEISNAFALSAGNKVFIDDRISGIFEQVDLSIVHLSSTQYAQLCADNQLLSNALYIVEDSFTNNYGKQIKNVAEPTESSDSATKWYVDNAVSSIEIPDDLSSFTNSPGYLVSDDISGYYKKTETSSASEISIELQKYQLSGDYLSSNALDDYKTYAATMSSLSNDGYATSVDVESLLQQISILSSQLSSKSSVTFVEWED